MKKKNYLTEDGLIVDIATNGVVGYKCTQCSTAHLLEGESRYEVELAAQDISAWQESHKSCGAAVLA